jgi:hypothetical protein
MYSGNNHCDSTLSASGEGKGKVVVFNQTNGRTVGFFPKTTPVLDDVPHGRVSKIKAEPSVACQMCGLVPTTCFTSCYTIKCMEV